jgi:hypothetical protein
MSGNSSESTDGTPHDAPSPRRPFGKFPILPSPSSPTGILADVDTDEASPSASSIALVLGPSPDGSPWPHEAELPLASVTVSARVPTNINTSSTTSMETTPPCMSRTQNGSASPAPRQLLKNQKVSAQIVPLLQHAHS